MDLRVKDKSIFLNSLTYGGFNLSIFMSRETYSWVIGKTYVSFFVNCICNLIDVICLHKRYCSLFVPGCLPSIS